MTPLRLGYLYGLGAYLLWGFFPLYLKLLRPAGPLEILAHRIVWSVLFVALLLAALRNVGFLRALLRRPWAVAGIVVAAALIAVNWGTYIYGVNSDRVVETALGYFINPLVVVLLGVTVLRERLRPAQWVALGIGASAVAVLTVDYGRLPWLALTLAFSFAGYGLVKKRLGLPAAEGLFVESAVLALPALGYLGWLTAKADLTFGHVSAGHTALLVLAGAATAIPLLHVRRGGQPTAPEQPRHDPVPGADPSARLRCADLPRADAAGPPGRLRTGLAGPDRLHRRRRPHLPPHTASPADRPRHSRPTRSPDPVATPTPDPAAILQFRSPICPAMRPYESAESARSAEG